MGNYKDNPRYKRYTFRLNQMEHIKLKALLMMKVDVPEILRQGIRDAFEKKSGGK